MLSDNWMKVCRLLCWFIVSVWHPEGAVSFLKEKQATHNTFNTVSYRFMLCPTFFFFRWYKWSEGVNAVDSSFDHRGDAIQLHNCSSGWHDWGGFSFSPSHIFCWRLGSNYTLSEGEYFCVQHTGEQYFIVVTMMSLKMSSGWCTSSKLNLVLCVGGREYLSHYFEGSEMWKWGQQFLSSQCSSVIKLRWCSVLMNRSDMKQKSVPLEENTWGSAAVGMRRC